MAANLIAEHGQQIIRPATMALTEGPAAISPPIHPTIPAVLPAAPVARVAKVTDNLLIEAIDEFERAVERRANSEGTQNEELLKIAAGRVKEQLDTYLKEVTASGVPIRARGLKQRVEALRAAGDQVVRNEDERRTVLADYWSRFESIDLQIKKTLDKSNWKIFGRVISRQSLLKLSRDLEEIGRQSTQLNVRDAAAGAAEDAITSSQRRFGADLEANAAGLNHSQGVQWVAELRKAYTELVEARGRLWKIDADNLRAIAPFERSSEDLKALLRSLTAAEKEQGHAAADDAPNKEVWSRGQAHIDAQSGPPAAAVPRGPLLVDTLVSGAKPVAPAARAVADYPSAMVRSSIPSPGHDGAMIATISGAVLFILLVISITTVRSIVVPIRQFMATTDRLARGDEQARFARGGIKELDALAMSFNRMAVSLAEARAATRQYQGALESRVDERTRQLQHLAEHDPLTGLPNRRQLVTRLDASLERAGEANTQVVVYFIDLDNFKNINDSMGHAFGDLVLRGVAQRLRDAAGTSGFAARLGGDEFTIIQESVGDRFQAADFGNALIRAFQAPLLIEGRELTISISAGAAIYPEHERESDALLRAADAALFRAKNSGRARVALFSPELLEAAEAKFSLEQGLRRALERGELELWFQPEVNFEIMGAKLVEALLRWRLPDGRYLAPADFLSVAEDSGLIRNINDWVVRTAFQHAAQWHYGDWPDVRVAINVSARQLLDSGFVSSVRAMLEEFRLPPRCIEIELTESVLQTEVATIEVLRELRRLDISIALDDFGTGYSSLASLERLPLTRVKLDRSLIDTIDSSARSLAIARAIIGLCENLGLDVTAEGIERVEQLTLVLASSAITLQGYLLSRPVRADEVPNVLARLRGQMEELLLVLTPRDAAPAVVAQDRLWLTNAPGR